MQARQAASPESTQLQHQRAGRPLPEWQARRTAQWAPCPGPLRSRNGSPQLRGRRGRQPLLQQRVGRPPPERQARRASPWAACRALIRSCRGRQQLHTR